MTRGRLRLLLAVTLTLVLVGPLAWVWWSSLLPSSYSAADLGRMDLGGGPPVAHGEGASVADLTGPATGEPDVEVDLTARQGTVRLADGVEVAGYTLDGSSPGPLVEATVGDLVQVTLRNADVAGGVALHWHGVDVPNAEDGVAGVTQDAVPPGGSHTYRWVAPDAGTYWYHSHQLSHDQVVGGLLGPLVIHPRGGSDGVRDVLAVAHRYAGEPTVDGHHDPVPVVAEPGERVCITVAVNRDAKTGPPSAEKCDAVAQ